MHSIFEAPISLPNWAEVSRQLKLPRELAERQMDREKGWSHFFFPLRETCWKEKRNLPKCIVCTYELLSDLIKFWFQFFSLYQDKTTKELVILLILIKNNWQKMIRRKEYQNVINTTEPLKNIFLQYFSERPKLASFCIPRIWPKTQHCSYIECIF